MSAATKEAARYIAKSEAGVRRERKNVVVDREIDRLHKKHGAVSPALLLEEAKDDSSPLHGFFEWNDTEAAHRYRIAQASAMLAASKFVLVLGKQGKEPIAALPEVRRLLPSHRGAGKFKMRNEVLGEPDARREIVEAKLGVLRGWCRETADIDELSSLRDAIRAHLPG